VAEGLALALFLVMAPSVLQLEPWLRAVQSGVGLTLVLVLLLAGGAAGRGSGIGCRHRSGHGSRCCEPWGRAAGCCGRLPLGSTIGPPVGHVSPRVARHPRAGVACRLFTALIVVNLGGLLRPTPANVGVTRRRWWWGCCRSAWRPRMRSRPAGAAGVQVLPVLFLGAMVTGWRLLKLESELA